MDTFNPLLLVVAEAILIGGFIWWDLREMSRRFERRHAHTTFLHDYENGTRLPPCGTLRAPGHSM